MKITVSPSSLARQLPELRLDIIQLYDRELTIEGKPVDAPPKQNIDEAFPILTKHPTFIDVFSRGELQLLSALADGPKTTRYLSTLVCADATSNVFDVRIMNLRRKIKRHKLPIGVETLGKTGFRKLVEK